METLSKVFEDKYNKNVKDCTNEEIYHGLLSWTKEQLKGRGYQEGKKKIYYISAEFLIGKLLSNNLINLGVYDEVAKYLKENGKELSMIEEIEPEPSLGNGGLGRLAACFLDSIATLGLPGEGIGLNYHLGLFKQEFKDHLQFETPNPWIQPESWLTDAGVSYYVPFKGFMLKSTLYDIDVAGYENKAIKLRLFDIDIADESIVGEGISFNKEDLLHNLSLCIYIFSNIFTNTFYSIFCLCLIKYTMIAKCIICCIIYRISRVIFQNIYRYNVFFCNLTR